MNYKSRTTTLFMIFLFVSNLRAEITKENDDFSLGKVIGNGQVINQLVQDGVLIKTSDMSSSDMPKVMFDKNIGLEEAEWLGAKTIVGSKHLSNIANTTIYVYGIIIGLNKELVRGRPRTYWKVLTGFYEQRTPLILNVGLDYHLRLMHDSWMSYNREQKLPRNGGILESPKHRYLILKDLPVDQAIQVLKQEISKDFNDNQIYLEEIPVEESLPATPSVDTVKPAVPEPVAPITEKAKPPKPIVPTYSTQNINNSFIEFDPAEVYYHTGAKEALRFYGEYRVKQYGDLVSFKVTDCDSVPIYTFGDIRYFFTSAIGGNLPHWGEPIKIEDPSITNIVAVRASNQASHHRVELYIGYNRNEFKSKRNKRFHSAKLLALHAKDTHYVEYTGGAKFFAPANSLGSNEINREICKHIEDRKDWNWNSDIFQGVVRNLLGEGWTSREENLFQNSPRPSPVYRRDEVVFGNGALYSTKIYWTQTENKLKGITYRH